MNSLYSHIRISTQAPKVTTVEEEHGTSQLNVESEILSSSFNYG